MEFTVTQTNPIELTENLGSDPSFFVPVSVTCSDKKANERLSLIDGLYYHASEGWVPTTSREESSLGDIIPDHDDLQAEMQRVFDDFGQSVLIRSFRLSDALYDKNHVDAALALADNDIDLKPLMKEGKA